VKRLLLVAVALGLVVFGMSLKVRHGELRSGLHGKRTVWLKHACPCDSGKVVHRWRIG
jgi:hypothetical protein